MKCDFCDFRGFPNNVRMHRVRHLKPEPDEDSPDPASEDPAEVELTPNGRVRRHAASKATLKVANAIKQLKTSKARSHHVLFVD